MSEAGTMPPAGTAEAAGAAPGARLAEARQAQSLATADVARQLKLSVWQVEALEAGHYQQLPGPVFVRGFIRNYARLLRLDPDELLRAAGDRLPRSAPRSETPPSQDIPFPGRSAPRWPLFAGVTAVVVGLLAVYEFYFNEPEVAPTRAVAVTPAPAALPSSKGEGKTASPPPAGKAQGVKAGITVAATVLTAHDAPTVQDAPTVAMAGLESELDKLPRPGARRVQLIFDEESWVEIRDRDERIIFSQLNRPGTRQSVSGLPPFALVVGNAHGVRLSFDDKPVDLAPHIRTDVARLILQ